MLKFVINTSYRIILKNQIIGRSIQVKCSPTYVLLQKRQRPVFVEFYYRVLNCIVFSVDFENLSFTVIDIGLIRKQLLLIGLNILSLQYLNGSLFVSVSHTLCVIVATIELKSDVKHSTVQSPTFLLLMILCTSKTVSRPYIASINVRFLVNIKS